MNVQFKLCIAMAASALVTVAVAQTPDRTAGEATRDAANAVGRAASAAVTPGDQNLGRNPDNRSGGLMGNDRSGTGSAASSVGRAASAAVTPGDQDMGRNPANRSGGMMGTDNNAGNSTGTAGTRSARSPRADRN